MIIKERKRFLDSAILNTAFFLKLNLDERLFWIILQLKCDTIGQFEMEGEILFAERMHGLKIDPQKFLNKVNCDVERLRNLGSGRWFLTQFIRVQYGRLTPTCKPHTRYIKDLKESGLWNTFIEENPDLKPVDRVTIDYCNPIDTPEEEEEEKEADKEQEEEKESVKEEEKETEQDPPAVSGETPLDFEKRNRQKRKRPSKKDDSIYSKFGISKEESKELPY